MLFWNYFRISSEIKSQLSWIFQNIIKILYTIKVVNKWKTEILQHFRWQYSHFAFQKFSNNFKSHNGERLPIYKIWRVSFLKVKCYTHNEIPLQSDGRNLSLSIWNVGKNVE